MKSHILTRPIFFFYQVMWKEGLRAAQPEEACGDPHAPANMAMRRMCIDGAH